MGGSGLGKKGTWSRLMAFVLSRNKITSVFCLPGSSHPRSSGHFLTLLCYQGRGLPGPLMQTCPEAVSWWITYRIQRSDTRGSLLSSIASKPIHKGQLIFNTTTPQIPGQIGAPIIIPETGMGLTRFCFRFHHVGATGFRPRGAIPSGFSQGNSDFFQSKMNTKTGNINSEFLLKHEGKPLVSGKLKD